MERKEGKHQRVESLLKELGEKYGRLVDGWNNPCWSCCTLDLHKVAHSMFMCSTIEVLYKVQVNS